MRLKESLDLMHWHWNAERILPDAVKYFLQSRKDAKDATEQKRTQKSKKAPKKRPERVKVGRKRLYNRNLP